MSGYRTKKFSQLTNNSVKTLRHYDKIGILKPAKKSLRGFSLYSEDDRLRLQNIMVLKFLGYSLSDIKLMLSKTMRLEDFSEIQSAILEKEFIAARNKMWLDQQIKINAERNGTPNWPMISKVLTMLQVGSETLEWQRNYYTESEYNELAQATLQHSPEWWDDYYARWRALFKEVEQQLHTDPKGPVGLMLAKKWLQMKDEVSLSAEVQKKSWEAMQKGLMPQESFSYNPLVVEYITKATMSS